MTPVADLEPAARWHHRRARLVAQRRPVAKLDLREGDVVFVEKGGEIIPKIVGMIAHLEVEVICFPKSSPSHLNVLSALQLLCGRRGGSALLSQPSHLPPKFADASITSLGARR